MKQEIRAQTLLEGGESRMGLSGFLSPLNIGLKVATSLTQSGVKYSLVQWLSNFLDSRDPSLDSRHLSTASVNYVASHLKT